MPTPDILYYGRETGRTMKVPPVCRPSVDEPFTTATCEEYIAATQ